jgi:hypothetical protein
LVAVWGVNPWVYETPVHQPQLSHNLPYSPISYIFISKYHPIT